MLFALLHETIAEWTEDKAQRLGAALAYYTVFSAAPLLIIAIGISSAVFGQAGAETRIVSQVQGLVGPAAAVAVAGMIEQNKIPGQGSVLTTVIGVVTLILGAVSVFGALQDAFNTIWEVAPRPGRSLSSTLNKRLMPFILVLGAGALLLVVLVLNTVMASISAYLGPRVPYFGLLTTLVNLILPLVILTVLFAALFKVIPDVHLVWRDVWPGALLTAVLFTVGQLAIGWYLSHRGLGSGTSPANSMLALLLWVYYSAQILYFGAEFTQVYMRRLGRGRPVPHADAQPVTEAARADEGLVRGGDQPPQAGMNPQA